MGIWSGIELQCDEYPFAATRKRPLTWSDYPGTTDRHSARLIDGLDNTTAGGGLYPQAPYPQR